MASRDNPGGVPIYGDRKEGEKNVPIPLFFFSFPGPGQNQAFNNVQEESVLSVPKVSDFFLSIVV